MKAALELSQVTKTYRRGTEAVNALNGFTLSVPEGSFLALAGPSGSGKSTALHIMGALDTPNSGTVLVKGHPVHTYSERTRTDLRRRYLGFVFQSYNLIPVLTAWENIEYVLQLQDIGHAERASRTNAVLKEVGLSDRAHHFPAQLSGGQQQRVAIARAIVGNPSVVLADEPTANLDSRTGLALIDLMIDLNEQKGVTFVFSTHDQKILDKAHRVVQLEDGQIVS
jgi:putative ABC transport system ATP-binding protein